MQQPSDDGQEVRINTDRGLGLYNNLQHIHITSSFNAASYTVDCLLDQNSQQYQTSMAPSMKSLIDSLFVPEGL